MRQERDPTLPASQNFHEVHYLCALLSLLVPPERTRHAFRFTRACYYCCRSRSFDRVPPPPYLSLKTKQASYPTHLPSYNTTGNNLMFQSAHRRQAGVFCVVCCMYMHRSRPVPTAHVQSLRRTAWYASCHPRYDHLWHHLVLHRGKLYDMCTHASWLCLIRNTTTFRMI